MPLRTESTRSRGIPNGLSIALAPVIAVLLAVFASSVLLGGELSGRASHVASEKSLPTASRAGGDSLATMVGLVGDGRLSGEVQEREVALDVPQAAREVLVDYRERGLLLAEAGYLDLRGDVWGCVVWSGSWSEVCIVQALPYDEGSEVRVIRIEGAGWEE